MVKVVLIGEDESLYTMIDAGSAMRLKVTARYSEEERFVVEELKPSMYDLVLVTARKRVFDSLEDLPRLPHKKLVLVRVASSAINAIYYYGEIKVHIKLETMKDVIKFVEALYLFIERANNGSTFSHSLQTAIPAKTKLVVKKGDEYSTLHINDAVYFFSENRVIYVVDQEGRKYMTEYINLDALLQDLKATDLFKANRKTVINLKHVVKFRRVSKSKYQLLLTASSKEPLYITPLNMAEFNHRIRSL